MMIYETVKEAAFKLDPPQKDSVTGKLIDILGFYALSLTPQLWYTPDKLTVLFRTFRGQVENKIGADKKQVSTMKMKPEEKKAEFEKMKKERVEDLKKVRDMIPDLVGDFRKRRDAMLQKLGPGRAEIEKKEKDLAWVEDATDKGLIKKWQDSVLDATEEQKLKDMQFEGEAIEVEKKETAPAAPKQKGTGIMEFTKFEGIKEEMHGILGDISSLNNKLKTTEFPKPTTEKAGVFALVEGMLPSGTVEAGDETYAHIDKAPRTFADLEKEHDEYMAKLREELDKNERDFLNRGIAEHENDMKEKVKTYPVAKADSPVYLAQIVAGGIQWYKKLNSMYQSVIWVKNKITKLPVTEEHTIPRPKKAEEDVAVAPAPVDKKSLADLLQQAEASKGAMLNKVGYLTEASPLSASTRNKAALAFKATEKFITDGNDYMFEYEKAKSGRKATLASAVARYAVELGEQAKVPEFDKVFPREATIARLNTLKDEETKRWATEELEVIHTFFKRQFMHPSSKLLEVAKNSQKTPQEILSGVIEKVLDVFVKTWQKKDKSQEKGQTSHWTDKYEGLRKIIEYGQTHNIFPHITMQTTKKDEPGRPSSEEINKYLENWIHMPQAFAEMAKGFEDIHGGAGASSSGREKIPKPVVHGAQEVVDRLIVDFINDRSEKSMAFINRILKEVGHGITQHTDESDEASSMSTVVTAVLGLLKNTIPTTIKNLRVQLPGVRKAESDVEAVGGVYGPARGRRRM